MPWSSQAPDWPLQSTLHLNSYLTRGARLLRHHLEQHEAAHLGRHGIGQLALGAEPLVVDLEELAREVRLVAVGQVSSSYSVLVVHPSVAAQSVKELIALAKAQPGKLNFGSAGNASGNHLATEQFQSLAGVKLTHVPFKGGAPALTALMAGEIDLAFDPMITTLQQLNSGRIRPLAVSTQKRAPQLPHLPTLTESGVKGYDATNWGGILVPAATPRTIIDRLNVSLNQGLAKSDVRERMLALGAEPLSGTPEELGELIKRELARTGKIIRDAGLRAE